MSDTSYRASHASAKYGERYAKTYQRGYYAAQWVKIEQPLLQKLFASVGGPTLTCLDFAAGTGRISAVAAESFGRVVGVDVSESMLALAAGPENVIFVRQDITRLPLDEQFDVALAFRFFLNAEDALRRDALRALQTHLKPGGRLICNIHMNSTSPVGILYKILNRLMGREVQPVISRADFKALLASEGFLIDSIQAYGFLPRPGGHLPGLTERLVLPVERLAEKLRVSPNLAQSFLVVARTTA